MVGKFRVENFLRGIFPKSSKVSENIQKVEAEEMEADEFALNNPLILNQIFLHLENQTLASISAVNSIWWKEAQEILAKTRQIELNLQNLFPYLRFGDEVEAFSHEDIYFNFVTVFNHKLYNLDANFQLDVLVKAFRNRIGVRVKKLYIDLCIGQHPEDPWGRILPLPLFYCHIFQSLSNLVELVLDITTTNRTLLDELISSFPPAVPFPSLKRIKVTTYHNGCRAWSDDKHRIIFHTLTALAPKLEAVSCAWGSDLALWLEVISKFPGRLEKLRRLETYPTDSLMDFILRRDWNLEAVDFRICSRNAAAVEKILEVVGSGLRELRLQLNSSFSLEGEDEGCEGAGLRLPQMTELEKLDIYLQSILVEVEGHPEIYKTTENVAHLPILKFKPQPQPKTTIGPEFKLQMIKIEAENYGQFHSFATSFFRRDETEREAAPVLSQVKRIGWGLKYWEKMRDEDPKLFEAIKVTCPNLWF